MTRFLLMMALLAPGIVLAAPTSLKELGYLAVTYINAGIGVTLMLGIVIYFYGVSTSLPKLKSDDSARLQAHFVWGLLALFVMFSVWGILALLRNTLFGGGTYDPLSGSSGGSAECTSLEGCILGGENNGSSGGSTR